MKNLLAVFCWVVVAATSFAQTTYPASDVIRCWSHELQQARNQRMPGYNEAVQQTFERAQQRAQFKAAHRLNDTTVYRIPVVVHVVWNTAAENLSDAIVQSQIDKLNEDYRRMNADAANTRDIFMPVVADARIEFYLATEDPDGNPTNGIVRVQTDRTDFSATGGVDPFAILDQLMACGLTLDEILGLFGLGTPPSLTPAQEACANEVLAGFGGGMDEMKFADTGGSPAWDTERYCNIWVCDLNGDNPTLGLLLGFAYPPVGAPNWPAGQNGTAQTDGVAVHYQAFGNNTSNTAPLSPFADDGRTTVHEVGHYLGLRHIWGDDACGIDDGIADTPDSDAATDATAGCDFNLNNCTETGLIQYPDMIENYMDYSSDECQNLFTRGQVNVMRAMVEGPRVGLLWQNILEAPNADFSANLTTALVNQTVQFTDLSSSATSWYWDFGDGTASTDQNPAHAYTAPGVYSVTLTVQNDFGFDFETKTSYVSVDFPTGLGNATTNNGIKIVPNPTKGIVTLQAPQGDQQAIAVTVWNAVGQQVYQQSNLHNQANIDLSHLAAGIYMVHTTTAKGLTTTTKLTVQP